MDLGAQIPLKHSLRVVITAIDMMDLSELLTQYKRSGTTSYHPKMLLKVLVYANTASVLIPQYRQNVARKHLLHVVVGQPANRFSDHQPLSIMSGEGRD